MQLTHTKTLLAAVTASAMIAGTASGDLYVYEPFDYSTGALAGNSGALGLSGNWSSSGSNQQSVVSPGLEFAGLSTTGNAARRTSAPGGAESSVALDATAISNLTQDNSTIYFSVLLRNDRFSAGNENLAFVIGTDALAVPGSDLQNPTIVGGEGFGVHLDGNVFNDPDSNGDIIEVFGYQIDDGVATQSTPSNPIVATDDSVSTFMIVGKIDWAPNGSNDTLTLYNVADPTTGLPGSSFATMSADLDNTLFDTLAVESQQVATIDEIRFGTSLTDVGVVPEPGSLALLGLGGLLIGTRRRRA